jgi:hypothetical protein
MSVHVLRTIELEALQIFKAVVDFGGVNKGCCAPASGAFKRYDALKTAIIEEGLGTKLFHRHSRKLLLSSEGHLLLAYAEQLLRLSSEAELALRSGKPRGKLRIGTLESTAATRLPPVLARYHRANDSRRAPRAGISLCDRGRFRRRTFRVSRLGDDAGLSRKARCNRPEGNYRD